MLSSNHLLRGGVMKRSVLALLVLFLGMSLGPAYGQRHRGVSITSTDDLLSDDCAAHLHFQKSDFQSVVHDEESRTLPNQPLTIHAEQNGGMQVTSWDKPEFSIKLCKYVGSHSDDEGRAILGQTKLDVTGSTVSVKAPSSDGDYSMGTLLLVRAPKNADLKLSVQNGGISLNRFSGTAEAEAMNGGISMKKSSGKLKANAENGGVSIEDCSGEVTTVVENGGLSLKLPKHWEGKGLDARTENGGLVISLPGNFDSGLEVETSEHVSLICRSVACDNGQHTRENGARTFRLGNSPVQIHASTVNGGVVIEDRDRGEGEI
jgi:DUF4097 and DUF4098 domain-containing protein YvlB